MAGSFQQKGMFYYWSRMRPQISSVPFNFLNSSWPFLTSSQLFSTLLNSSHPCRLFSPLLFSTLINSSHLFSTLPNSLLNSFHLFSTLLNSLLNYSHLVWSFLMSLHLDPMWNCVDLAMEIAPPKPDGIRRQSDNFEALFEGTSRERLSAGSF